MEDEPGSGQDEKDESDEFGYQNFEGRNGYERHLSPPETCKWTFPFIESGGNNNTVTNTTT